MNEPLFERLSSAPTLQRLYNHARDRDAAQAALEHYCHGVPSPVKDWEKTRTWQQIRSVCLNLVIEMLAQHHQRATYGAVAGIVGGIAQSVMAGRPKTPLNSWIVNANSNLPTGYSAEEIAPHHDERTQVICTSEELRDWLAQPR